MSLYRYKVILEGGKEKTGSITAKTEAEAQARIEASHPVVEWSQIKAEAEPASAAPPVPKPVVAAKLSRMLFLQHGLCFFCGQPLSEADASIEHLLPLSKGGARTEDNEVVCHTTLNETFGNMDLKRKFEFTLKAAGNFKCPER